MANILKEFSQIHLEIIHFVKLEDEPIMIFNKSNDRAIICSNISSKTNQKLILNKTETQGLDVKLI
jgi:hypothetical protein